ncbi:hypothetical protein SBOR_8439 [Sclerotinia borealis F-4128]|uniref:Cyclin N-terminal domain-containing protein n=1 Tax=Sclerotinia borealis (strain F-4128) TaxID=1432307 RepID=W9C8I4_SCLBF|nr:hypothetical protein SBOR_8439 [Sclerotinia borealis F-4128]
MPAKAFDQWLFTEAELKATPSILEGLSPEEERTRRAKGVSFMSSIGNMLHVPMTTEIAATALFLATKTEETIRGTKPFIFACIKVAQKNPKLEVDASSKEYWRWRDSILMYEELMLELLCFDLSAPSPLKYLVNFFEELTAVGIDSVIIKELRNYTWALICDTHHSILGLMTTPRIIAITTLLLAATAKKCEIPQINGKDWWEHLGGSEPRIVEAGLFLHKFLSNSPFQFTDQDQPGSAAAKYLHASSGKEEHSSDDAAANSEQTQSQNGNGHVHENGTNGSDSNSQPDPELHNDQPSEKAENSQSESKPRTSSTSDDTRPSPTSLSEDKPDDSMVSGTDDAPLKAAANDLSSHHQIRSANDVLSNIDSDTKSSPKRKADEQIEEAPLAKRAKREDTSFEAAQDDPEPSHEGKALSEDGQGSVQVDKDHATKDHDSDSEIDSETVLAKPEAGVSAEEKHEERGLEQQ